MSSTNHSPSHHQQTNDDEIDLSELFSTLWFHKWHIAAITTFCTAVGVLYALSATPVYQADAMVEITGTKNQVLGELSDLLGGSQQAPTDTEVELIKSRLILGKSVNDLGLDLVIKPKNGFLNKLFPQEKEPELKIDQFNVNPLWLNRTFTLTAQGSQNYQLKPPEGDKVYAGKVGQPLKIDANTSITVNRLNANIGQVFKITKYTQLASIERLRQNLNVAPKGKNVPVLGLSLTGSDPLLIQNTLNRIIINYTEHNRNKDVQTATSSLQFIDGELPKLEAALHDAEDKLNVYRAKKGTLDVSNEARSTIDSLNKIEMQLVDLKTEESVLSEVYTHEHPAYKALMEKMDVLKQAKERLNRQITQMPETQQTIIQLTRDVEINQAVYVQLLNKRQELGILRASSQGNVRLIDSALTAEEPIKPKKAIIVLLAMVLGAFLSSGFYLLRSLLHKGISEDDIGVLGLDLLGSVPLSDMQFKSDKLLKKTIKKGKDHVRSTFLLAQKEPTDPSVEALRALRTTLYFRMLDMNNKSIMISGATPEVGKSFVSVNLATLMALGDNKKVLLIDGDMRKGYLHHMLGLPNKKKGLSDILSDAKVNAQYNGYIQTTSVPHLDFICLGSDEPKNPSELLLGNRFAKLIEWANKHYDYVIVDTPPVMAVTDAAMIGQYMGQSLLVTRFGKTDARELMASVNRFAVNNVNIDGVVLNGIVRTAKNYYNYNYSYANAYTKTKKKQD